MIHLVRVGADSGKLSFARRRTTSSSRCARAAGAASFATVNEVLAWARELPDQTADVFAVSAEQVHRHFDLGSVK